MTKKEYVDYLNTFPDDTEVSFIVANPSAESRTRYPVRAIFFISDADGPVACLEVGSEESLDGQELI